MKTGQQRKEYLTYFSICSLGKLLFWPSVSPLKWINCYKYTHTSGCRVELAPVLIWDKNSVWVEGHDIIS